MEDKKELKYPIKYAIIPIEERIGSCHGLNELESKYDVVANIVSKCYVVGKRKDYLSDGTYKNKYEVVFPFLKKDIIYFDRFKKVEPEYDFYSKCINSIFVSQLFDDFREAQLEVDKANEEILDHMIGLLPYNKDFQKKLKELKKKHQETLGRYKKIEEIIEEKTSLMKVTKSYDFDLECLIEKIVERPREFYIKLAKELSLEEREYLKQLIENRSCTNCINDNCSIEYSSKVGLDKLGNSQGSECLSWSNHELVGRQLIQSFNKK